MKIQVEEFFIGDAEELGPAAVPRLDAPLLAPEGPPACEAEGGAARPADGPRPADEPAVAGPARERKPFLDELLRWTDVRCGVCHQPAGQFKYHPCPGGRDGPVWYMRVKDAATGQWAERCPWSICRRTTTTSEDASWPLQWIDRNKTCRSRCG